MVPQKCHLKKAKKLKTNTTIHIYFFIIIIVFLFFLLLLLFDYDQFFFVFFITFIFYFLFFLLFLKTDMVAQQCQKPISIKILEFLAISCRKHFKIYFDPKNQICTYNIVILITEAPLKKGVLKNFENFAGKHLCWSLVLIKLQS